MVTKWRCTVCGYIHEGEEPPENCPICGAESDKFVALEEPKVSLLREMVELFEPHPVTVHFPNALLPTLALFVFIALVSDIGSFDTAAFYLLVVVLCTVPITFATGLRDWKRKFDGQMAAIFKKKIVLASTLVVLTIVTVAIRTRQPELMQEGGGMMVLYLVLILLMLGCVTLLGHYGAKLMRALIDRN
ncbi:MAG: hypothetical protein C0623_10400 [Desulfuromonas sp.]|nr:MAG: hypothetical protein C0623_10400 [Desulfuromonas sp.]